MSEFKTCIECKRTISKNAFSTSRKGKILDFCRKCGESHGTSESHKRAMRKYYNAPRGRYNMLRKRLEQCGIMIEMPMDAFLETWNALPHECHFCGSKTIDKSEIENKRIVRSLGRATLELIPDMMDGEIIKICAVCNLFRRGILPEKVMKKIGEWVREDFKPFSDNFWN